MTPDVCLKCSSLVYHRTRREMTCRPGHQTTIRSQTYIGARHSSAIVRAGRMADREFLLNGAWSVLMNLVVIVRRVAVVVGLTVAASSICPHVP
ncbi:hypothetical protein M405DRAFT_350004 [Rhizopogon salebrosus TDB-379]|nr:hypothetical protein M405DRAFT_350004 [Rhizopogon salebrosus TDB-379]